MLMPHAQLYVIQGGYKAFFNEYPVCRDCCVIPPIECAQEHCDPQDYRRQEQTRRASSSARKSSLDLSLMRTVSSS